VSMPITDPVAAGRQHDADLRETEAALAEPNPHLGEMDLPASMMEDGT
jgi:hypothetical protein